MTIAELFVKIGVKGGDESAKQAQKIGYGLKEIKQESIAAKLAILGLVYGLKNLMAQSSEMGTSLMNFKALTGQSTQELQRWQYGMRQAGMASEEAEQSLKAVQNVVATMASGKGAPEGMNRIAQMVGFDPKKMSDTFYVLDKLREYAKRTASATGNDLAIANQAMHSFGFSDNAIAAARRGSLDPSVRNRAPVYSDRQADQMSKVGVQWSNLGNKIQMAIGQLNAKHGMQLVKDLTEITTQVIRLVDALAKLSEQLMLFKMLSAGMGVIADAFNGAADMFNTKKSEKDKKMFPSPVGILWHAGKQIYDAKMAVPRGTGTVPPKPAGPTNKTNNVKIDIHGVKGAAEASGAIRQEIQRTMRQMQAQGQGS